MNYTDISNQIIAEMKAASKNESVKRYKGLSLGYCKSSVLN